MKFLLRMIGLIVLMGAFLYSTEAYLTMNFFRAGVAFLLFTASFLLIIQPKFLREWKNETHSKNNRW